MASAGWSAFTPGLDLGNRRDRYRGIMGVAVMFIIATTVRLALHSRAEEIEVMQLVGGHAVVYQIPLFSRRHSPGYAGREPAVGLCYALFAVLMSWVKPMGSCSSTSPAPVPATADGRQHAGRGSVGVGSLFSLRRTTSPA
jgi:hypothetical protein